jgi:transposase InsO family protein
MPWKQTDTMTERVKLITEYLSGNYSVSELSRRFEVSRPIVYKWIERYEQGSWAGLQERSRAPHRQARALSATLEELILELKQRWPDWGAPKLRQKLLEQVGPQRCPAESTVSAVLQRHGLVKAKRRRREAVPGGAAALEQSEGANAVWSVDFKGWWRTQDGQRCEPLTISDAWSRYLLRCVAMRGGTAAEMVQPHFESVFREYGLPEAIRSDNGSPFASTGLGGLTKLSVWWLRLGIRLERIRPGCPQENGSHERMHLSLEKSSARTPRANLREQQAALEKFQVEYNEQRPHEALGQRVPASFYQPSPRIYSGRLPPAREYPHGWLTRQVKRWGQMKWGGHEVTVSQALAGERIGLEPREDGRWAIWFEELELGIFDERKGRIQPITKLPNPRQQTPAR